MPGVAPSMRILPEEPTEQVPLLEMPAHSIRESLLQSGSNFDNFRGFINLALLALVRLVLLVGRSNPETLSSIHLLMPRLPTFLQQFVACLRVTVENMMKFVAGHLTLNLYQSGT